MKPFLFGFSLFFLSFLAMADDFAVPYDQGSGAVDCETKNPVVDRGEDFIRCDHPRLKTNDGLWSSAIVKDPQALGEIGAGAPPSVKTDLHLLCAVLQHGGEDRSIFDLISYYEYYVNDNPKAWVEDEVISLSGLSADQIRARFARHDIGSLAVLPSPKVPLTLLQTDPAQIRPYDTGEFHVIETLFCPVIEVPKQ